MAQSRTIKAGILASGGAASAVVGLIIAAVLARVLDKSDYATYRQTLLAYNLAAPILSLGLPSALYYFMPDEESRARGVLLENLVLLGIAGLALSLFLALGGNGLLAHHFRNPELEKTLLVFSPYPILMLPASATAACLMVKDKTLWVAFHTLGTRIVTLILVFAAILLNPTPFMAVVGLVVAAVITFASGIALMMRSVSGSISAISLAGMKKQLAYSVPLGVGVMIGTLNINLDKLLVSIFTTPDNFAVYVNGAMEIPFIGVITGSATAVLLPEMRRLFKEGNAGEALALWKRAGIKSGSIIIPMMGLLLILAPDLMALLYSEKYRSSADVFRIYLLLLPIRIVIFGAVFQVAGRTDLIMKRSAMTLGFNLVLSVCFAIFLGYRFIAVSTVIVVYLIAVPYCLWKVASIFETVVSNVFYWKLVSKMFLLAALGGGVAVIANSFFHPNTLLIRLIVMSSLYALVVVTGLLLIGVLRVNLSARCPLVRRIEWMP